MPRCARKKSETQIYHIMMRGNNKEKVFIDDEDKLKIIDILRCKKEADEYYLYAYCVMDNHIHLVIKEGKDPLARTIKRITASYSYYFNQKYNRVGHVFQERYKSESIENESYLISAIRYIHQNPLKAGIGTIQDYEWSSYKDYMGEGREITDTEEIMSIFANSRDKAMVEFAIFNNDLNEEAFLDIAEEKEFGQENVADFINGFLNEKGLGIGDLKAASNKIAREDLVKLLVEKSNLSRREIAATLGLNRETVRKIAVSRDLSP